jgi:hypothetical protein
MGTQNFWKKNNIHSMVNAVNELLNSLDLRMTFGMSVNMDSKTLFLGQGTEYKTDIQTIGNQLHTMILILLAVRDKQVENLKLIKTIINNELIEMLDEKIYSLSDVK